MTEVLARGPVSALQGLLVVGERPKPDSPGKTVGIKGELRAHVGVRGGVLRDLRWEQLDWRHRLLHYASKGSEHVIPLSPEALRLLKELGPRPSGPVFPVRTDSTFKKY